MRFLVFSDDWGVHPSSCQHLFRHIAPKHQVAWINTVGMRHPRLDKADIKKALKKVSRMLAKTKASSPRNNSGSVRVYQPPMSPFANVAVWRRLNALSVSRTIKRIFEVWGSTEVTIVATVPNACDYIKTMPNQKIVYYCVDDFSEWPGLNRDLVLSMEHDLIEKADIFIASSPTQYARLKETGKPTHLLPHGVDLELFSSDPPRLYEALDGIPEPRVCYFGLFDERSDKALLSMLADKFSDISFVIAGNSETDVRGLQKHANIYFTGFVPYQLLPQLIKGTQVLILPYHVNKLSESLSPLKLKEYLVTGRPVISTAIPAVNEFGDWITVANTVEEWQSAILNALDASTQSRKEYFLHQFDGESWAAKSNQFLRICEAQNG